MRLRERMRRPYKLAATAFVAALLTACSGNAEPDTESNSSAAEGDSDGAGADEASAQETYDARLGSAGPGSAAYQMGAGITELGSRSDALRMSSLSTAGFAANLRMMQQSELELTLNNAPTYLEAALAVRGFEGEPPLENTQGVAFTYWGEATIACRADTGLTEVSELAGHTLASGPPGSGLDFYANIWMEAYDLEGEVDLERVAFEDGADAVIGGSVDCMVGGPAPYPTKERVAGQTDIVLLNFDDEEANQWLADQVGFSWLEMDDLYAWQDRTVRFPAAASYLLVRDDVPEEAVYDLTESLISDEGREHLLAINPGFQIWDTCSLIGEGLAFPEQHRLQLHPGAIRALEDGGGCEIPEHLAP